MKKSSIQRLPEEVRDYLNELLRGSHTQLEATDLVNGQLVDMGLDTKVSKSSVNRYAAKMAQFNHKIMQSREVADAFVGKLGSAPSGKIGHLLNEIIRTMAFDMTLAIEEDSVTPKMIGELALAVQRLEQASSESEKRERQIRDAERKDNQHKIEEMAKSKGLSTLTVAQIREALSE